FLAPSSPDTTNGLHTADTSASTANNLRKWRIASLALVASVAIAALYKTVNWDTLYLPNNHRTIFNATQGYTNETGHERGAT
ncbi:hypothetical protein, partial [Pseudomonas sp. AH2 (2023)]|uniref:hypothetical protein n=1 Tax=Pseudomonas sp. AH2 (2023) TaxID=3048599 RepID=UPI002B239CB4